jgi:hypothetical protein
MDTPDWLPLTINTDGDWDKVLVTLYSVFKRDFIKRNCYFDQYKIAYDARKNDSPYEEGFKWTPKIRQKNGQKIDKIMPCKNIIPENKKLKSYWKC